MCLEAKNSASCKVSTSGNHIVMGYKASNHVQNFDVHFIQYLIYTYRYINHWIQWSVRSQLTSVYTSATGPSVNVTIQRAIFHRYPTTNQCILCYIKGHSTCASMYRIIKTRMANGMDTNIRIQSFFLGGNY